MEIKPNEIEEVKDIGSMDGSPVRLLRTTGGFYVALGKPKGKKKDEALASGSHPAIVKYNVEKSFSDYQPILAKSESNPEENLKVVGFSELLPSSLRSKGFDMVMLQKNEAETYFVLTKYGQEMNSYQGKIESDSVKLSKSLKPITKETFGFSKAVAIAAAIKAASEGKDFVEHSGSKFKVAKLMEG